jgi:hypothetical protein
MHTCIARDEETLFPRGPAGTWGASPAASDPDTLVRRNGPETSKAAARSMHGNTRSIRARVLRYLIDCGRVGMINEECAAAHGLRTQTQTARMRELVQRGLARDSGERRRTSSGRAAIVWTATGEGVQR